MVPRFPSAERAVGCYGAGQRSGSSRPLVVTVFSPSVATSVQSRPRQKRPRSPGLPATTQTRRGVVAVNRPNQTPRRGRIRQAAKGLPRNHALEVRPTDAD